jgi:type II secretion system protein G
MIISRKNSRAGFTLIELLVVIAIIGLLASIVLASLNGARRKSRDARRIADLKQIQNALELYSNDNNGKYPSSASTVAVGGQAAGTALAGLVSGFIAAIPGDPLGGTNVYLYKSIPVGSVTNNATGYCIGASIEGIAPTPSSTCLGVTLIGQDADTGAATSPVDYEVGG